MPDYEEALITLLLAVAAEEGLTHGETIEQYETNQEFRRRIHAGALAVSAPASQGIH